MGSPWIRDIGSYDALGNQKARRDGRAFPSHKICSLCPGAISSMRSSTVYGRTCFAPITRNKFNAIYNKWRQRIREPDIRIHSNTQAWTKVPEFTSLVGLGELASAFPSGKAEAGRFCCRESP
jgi:hypothetical protein